MKLRSPIRQFLTLPLVAVSISSVALCAYADGVEFPKGSVYYFASHGDLPHVKRLIAANPGLVKSNDPRYGTLTWCAAFGGDLATVRHVVNRGSSLNAPCRGWFSSTPLMIAAEVAPSDDPKIAAYLISKGADVNTLDESGKSALLYALKGGHPKIAELLVAKGADVKVQNRDGMSALHFAAGRNDGESIRLLAEHGADVNLSGKQGTPLQVATRSNSSKAAEVLRQLGAKE